MRFRIFGGPLPADCSVLFRIGKEDFLLVAIASWRIFSGKILVDHDQVRVRFYGDGRPFAPGETCRLEEVFFRRGNSERELLDAYADFTAKNHAVNLNLCHWSGWGTWDYYSAKFSDRSIRENLDELEKLSSTVNLLQIDDGYSVWGDWMEILPQVLPDGLPAIVREAAGRNLKTGIWFAPFLAHCTANVVKKHPEWFLRREDGSLRYYGNGGHVILDYSQDEVVEHIRRCVRFFMDAGMVYLKLDFLLAGTAFGKSRVPMTPYERFHRRFRRSGRRRGSRCICWGAPPNSDPAWGMSTECGSGRIFRRTSTVSRCPRAAAWRPRPSTGSGSSATRITSSSAAKGWTTPNGPRRQNSDHSLSTKPPCGPISFPSREMPCWRATNFPF